MILRCSQAQRRSGAAMVETAFVMIIFLMLVFGITEYCRVIFCVQVVEAAAREGGRFAVTNGNDVNLVADTQALVNQRMGGVNTWLKTYTVNVYASDASGNNIGSASGVQFGQYIAVQVKGNYNPILPNFLFLGQTIPISFTCIMYSEGN